MKTLAFILILLPGLAFGLAPEYTVSWTNELNDFILRNPPYVWGAADVNRVDCSGYLYISARRSGIPVSRTVARSMANGESGWHGKDITLDDVNHIDVVWWTWKHKPDRIHGHVAVFLEGRTGLIQVTHSSSGRGVVLDELKGKLMDDISKLRRLTIGDKK